MFGGKESDRSGYIIRVFYALNSPCTKKAANRDFQIIFLQEINNDRNVTYKYIHDASLVIVTKAHGDHKTIHITLFFTKSK